MFNKSPPIIQYKIQWNPVRVFDPILTEYRFLIKSTNYAGIKS